MTRNSPGAGREDERCAPESGSSLPDRGVADTVLGEPRERSLAAVATTGKHADAHTYGPLARSSGVDRATRPCMVDGHRSAHWLSFHQVAPHPTRRGDGSLPALPRGTVSAARQRAVRVRVSVFPVVATAGEDLYLGSARTVSATPLSGRELPDSGAHRLSSRPIPDCSSAVSRCDLFLKNNV